MAHASTFPTPLPARREPLDGQRIAANASTIVINAGLILLLLVPLANQTPIVRPEQDDAIQIVELHRPRPRQEPEPVPVIQQPRPTPRPVAPTLPVPAIAPMVEPVVDAQPGDIAIEPADVVADAGDSLDPVPPVGGAQLQALLAPPPPYPAQAIRDGIGGVVELEILVDIDGRPLEARVVRSSGHRLLDQSARRTVLTRWKFQPAMRNGQPVQALGRVPIEFKLAN
jgi:protein TonB